MNTASSMHDISGRTSMGILCGAGAGALWGLVFLAPELARSFSPLELATGRYLTYGAIAAALIGRRWYPLLHAVGRREWIALFWLSLLGNSLYYVLLSSAVQNGGIAMTSLIIGFLPVAVTIIGSRNKEAVPLRALAPSLLLCTAGAVCIGWESLFRPVTSGRSLLGVLCALGALASWTAYAVGNSRCLVRLHHISAHDWNLLTGIVTGLQAVLLLPFAVLTDPLTHDLSDWSRFGAVCIGVAVCASIFGNALWNRMSRLLPLTMTGQMILFETLFALLYGFLWERRLPTLPEIAAFALVVASVLSCIATHRTHARRSSSS